MSEFRFSVCHATARPQAWQETYNAWLSQAAQPDQVEYILAVDRGGPFEGYQFPKAVQVVWNDRRHCCVDAYNAAARNARGAVLILGADDMFPCPDWDSALWSLIRDPQADFVVQVSSGIAQHDNRGLMTLEIFSRVRYQRLGYALYPEYESMFPDDDFSEHARQDGVVINSRHLLFPHRNSCDETQWDDVSRLENHPERYRHGFEVLRRRRHDRFGEGLAQRRTSIGLCLPGDSFSKDWVANYTQLLIGLLLSGYDPAPLFGYGSNVFVTRSSFALELHNAPLPLDYVLWIDNDNVVQASHIEQLLRDFQEHPEADLIAGWYWVQPNRIEKKWFPACGKLDLAKTGLGIRTYRWQEIKQAAAENRLMPLGYVGFGCCLMRYQLLVDAGENPFVPIISPDLRWGMSAEDMSFCAHAMERGAKLYVDPRVKVPHLKLAEVPDPPEPNLAGALPLSARIRQVFQPGHRANSEKEGVTV